MCQQGYNYMMGMQPQFMLGNCPMMMQMPEQKLESMYPKTYHIIYPKVKQHCNMMESQYGPTYCPSKDHFNSMVDNVCSDVEGDIETIFKKDRDETEEDRKMPCCTKNLLKDLVGIILLKELVQKPFYGGYPEYYPGMHGGGYPEYYLGTQGMYGMHNGYPSY